MKTDTFHHRIGPLVGIVALLSALLGLFLFAVLFGPGFGQGAYDTLWAWLLGVMLAGLIGLFLWVIRRRPRVLVVSEEGMHLPFAFRRPLRWDEIHRIRRIRTGRGLYGRQDWLIVDPLPGVLAPLRLPVWRRAELWIQKRHGVRIPLHGLDAAPDIVVRSIERFRPVREEDA